MLRGAGEEVLEDIRRNVDQQDGRKDSIEFSLSLQMVCSVN